MLLQEESEIFNNCIPLLWYYCMHNVHWQ